MKCPACGEEMTTEDFGIEVDVCESGCKGIWFDHGELVKLDEQSEGLGAALENALRSPRRNDDDRDPIRCPKCDIPMHTHKYNRAKAINVDECYGCGGFFLDSGELTEIRDHFMDDAEVAAYTAQMSKAVPEYTEELSHVQAAQKRAGAIHKLTKFLTVSYWRKTL